MMTAVIKFKSFILFITVAMLVAIAVKILEENQKLPMVTFKSITYLDIIYYLTLLFYDSFYCLFNGIAI